MSPSPARNSDINLRALRAVEKYSKTYNGHFIGRTPALPLFKLPLNNVYESGHSLKRGKRTVPIAYSFFIDTIRFITSQYHNYGK